ncbi:DUF5801 repeats-in-toxin domain-containing protein [Bradyrhizobium sp. CER78]|uniref:DUF5801 repeats-in-toxin domain-containing protein n=1 Tax=Bradyrhizobium sp. CER78 TaxID=3039162 RepID=UPI00244AF34E|nr:DUF5801 repeats-in-toxin domain-containing protein [Bradyrhizobium sp. CER78]MDH2384877.1 DUF5801 repeats-in-toxin domain-containing protein [Bradyrhizobium sp. CER78]
MLVASGVAFGGAGSADLGRLPRVIGVVDTVIGCGTIMRARDIALSVVAGDPVCQGDVIEVAAGGRVDIRLIDGAMLHLPAGTRLALGDLTQNSISSLRPGLFAKARSIFRLIGSRLAGSDVLTADTPVGTVRTSGLGLLSFAALTYSLLESARAAEPNVTLLDDDTITYKDLHHGVFELVTKEAIPRHIIVDDPGETIILTKRGSSVSVNHLTNSPAHMEELRDAQQETLANLERGSGSKGSSTPTYQGSPLLQPINFTEPDPAQTPYQLGPLPTVIPQFIITFKPPPTPPKLTFGAAPSLTLSATHLTATALDDNIAGSAPNVALTTVSGDFSVKFANPQDAAGATVSYALTITGGNSMASGVIDSHTGLADVLVLNSNTVEGHVGAADGTLAFTITLDPVTGYVIFTEYRSAMAPPGTNTDDNEAVSLATGIVTLIATVVKDGLSQDVTLDLGSRLTFIEDDPSISTNGTSPSLTLAEAHLTATLLDDNIAGSAPDAALTTTSADFSTAFNSVQGADGATISYALTIAGGSGTASGLIDSHTGLADILVLNGNSIEGHVGTATGTLAFTIALDPVTGRVTFTEYRAVKNPLGTNPDSGEPVALNAGLVSLVATITDRDADFRSASIDLGKQLTITDDGPSIKASGITPSLTLSEKHLTATTLDDHIAGSAPDTALTTTAADFSTAFTSVQGADGATIRYALTITGGNGTASGLIDSHTGCADVLVLNGNTIEGHVGTTNGTLAFTISLDPATGLVTFTEYRAVKQPFGTSPDSGEGVSLATGIVGLTATITDNDGDFQSASLDLGKQLTITDDGPSIKTSGTAPSLLLSESHLTATALDDHIAGSAPNAALTTTSADFSTAFTSVQGADGATICYALTIAGGNGTPSGLIDSHTGCADVLVLNGNTIEGHVGNTNGTLAFTIALDPATGLVTFTEYRAVEEPFCTSPDDAAGVSLAAGIIDLTATITDKDGDFQSASIDLGKQLSIAEDSPTIGGFPVTVIAAHDNQAAAGTYDVNFGADGEAAMHVAIHDGEVGSTGYDLATSSLGDGVTSVHVTGHGDDYTFYYSTHPAGGGVELDAYRTDSGGALCDPLFALLINPDGTYCFDFEKVEQLKDVTVTGSDFGASNGGSPQLTAPDAQLVVTGSDCAGHPLDVMASSDGISVGDDGQQIGPSEQLNLAFTEKQSQVDFTLAHWQDCGTATLTFKVLDGSTCVHDFSICVPKPSSGCAGIVVQETSNTSLINTYTFDNTTQTYTLYVGKAFNQVQIDYDRAEAGHPTFTVNNITYDEKTSLPSTDLLFDVSAVDKDGHSATTGLQVDIQGATTGAPAPILAPSPEIAAMAGSVISDQVTHMQHDLIL